VKRNKGLRGYRPKQAQATAQQRHKNRPRYLKLTADVKTLITDNIIHEWSPEQIKGRFKKTGAYDGLCYDYLWIYSKRQRFWRRTAQTSLP
jgi:IS30 family transposase